MHESYDAAAVTHYWRVLAATQRVLAVFAGRFNGKASPLQVFWHSFDLAYGRYSGRRAPCPRAPTASAPRRTRTR